jgi:hypothetical protein
VVGSVISVARAAFAAVTPLLSAAACAAVADGELLAEGDEDPHADAAATHATARTPIHAL